MSQPVVRGTASYLVSQLGIALLSVLAFAYVIRSISKAEMGAYSAILFLVSTIQVFASLGTSQIITKQVAGYVGSGDLHRSSKTILVALLVTSLLSAAIAAVMIAVSPWISSLLLKDPSYQDLILLGAIDLILISGPMSTFTAALLGYRKLKQLSVVYMVNAALFQLLSIAVIFSGLGVQGLLSAKIATDCVVTLLQYAFLRRDVGSSQDFSELPRLLRLSLPLLGHSAIGLVSSTVDRLGVLVMLSLEDMGTYSVALTVTSYAGAVTSWLSVSLLASYSSRYSAEGKEIVEMVARRVGRIMGYLSVPVGLIMGATSPLLLDLLTGGAYTGASTAVSVIAITLSLLAFTNAWGGMLVVFGKTYLVPVKTALGTILPVPLAILFIPNFGFFGAAATRSILHLAGAVISLSIVRLVMKVRIDWTGVAKSTLAGSVAALFAFALTEILPGIPVLVFPIVLLAILVYVLMLRLLSAVTPEDLLLLEELFGKRFGRLTRLARRFFATERAV